MTEVAIMPPPIDQIKTPETSSERGNDILGKVVRAAAARIGREHFAKPQQSGTPEASAAFCGFLAANVKTEGQPEKPIELTNFAIVSENGTWRPARQGEQGVQLKMLDAYVNGQFFCKTDNGDVLRKADGTPEGLSIDLLVDLQLMNDPKMIEAIKDPKARALAEAHVAKLRDPNAATTVNSKDIKEVAKENHQITSDHIQTVIDSHLPALAAAEGQTLSPEQQSQNALREQLVKQLEADGDMPKPETVVKVLNTIGVKTIQEDILKSQVHMKELMTMAQSGIISEDTRRSFQSKIDDLSKQVNQGEKLLQLVGEDPLETVKTVEAIQNGTADPEVAQKVTQALESGKPNDALAEMMKDRLKDPEVKDKLKILGIDADKLVAAGGLALLMMLYALISQAKQG
jgi:hypothetical protein